MCYSELKDNCPHCNNKDNHKIINKGKNNYFTGPLYKCNSCKKLFTIPDGCSSLYISIPVKESKINE